MGTNYKTSGKSTAIVRSQILILVNICPQANDETLGSK